MTKDLYMPMTLRMFVVFMLLTGCLSCAIAPSEPAGKPAPVTAPEASTAQPPSFSVTIRSDGASVLDGRVFRTDADLAALRIELDKTFKERSDAGEEPAAIVVKTPKEVKYGHVKRVVDELKKIEGARVAIQSVEDSEIGGVPGTRP